MQILTNCRAINKRYNANGVPLYDINCTYNEDYITIKGVQSYELNNDKKYDYLLCDKVYQTKKTKVYKVGYITLKIDKITPTLKRDWIIDSITLEGYELPLNNTTKDNLQYIADCIKSEAFYPNNINRFKGNNQNILANHLQGLPSYFAIPFSNFDIINLGRLWGYDLTGKKEDKFIENYWNAMASLILQTFRYYKIDF